MWAPLLGEGAEPEGSGLLFSPLIWRGFCAKVESCLELASFCWCFLGLLATWHRQIGEAYHHCPESKPEPPSVSNKL